MQNDLLSSFGAAIRYYRNELGISQEKLADKCSFHRTYIGQIERGERNPSLKNIQIFAQTFQISISTLLKKCEELQNLI